jgi:hypothetical protein
MRILAPLLLGLAVPVLLSALDAGAAQHAKTEGSGSAVTVQALKRRLLSRRSLADTYDAQFKANCLPKPSMNKYECTALQQRYISPLCQNDPSVELTDGDMDATYTSTGKRSDDGPGDQVLFPVWRGSGVSCPSQCAEWAAKYRKDVKVACGPDPATYTFKDPGGCQPRFNCAFKCQAACRAGGWCRWTPQGDFSKDGDDYDLFWKNSDDGGNWVDDADSVYNWNEQVLALPHC